MGTLATMAARQLLRRACPALLAPARKSQPLYHRPFPACAGLRPRKCAASALSCSHFATRAAADGYLVDLLKSEIEHELHEEASQQGSLKGSPAPFELTDKAGTEEVILSRSFGNEQIAVTCLIESAYSDDEEEGSAADDNSEAQENLATECLRLNFNITKGAETPVLEMECSFYRDGTDVTIETVSYLTDLSTDDSKPQPYEGPKFEDLDEQLQRAFHDLLKARGLTPKVATYVMDYLVVKEQREYMRWLHNVETFFSS